MLRYPFTIIILLVGSSLVCQSELIEIESGITIDNSRSDNPNPGTIRWTGSDFEGWNGVIWISLTGGIRVDEVTDVQGNAYRTIIIGDQEWMIDNLRVSVFNDGTSLSEPLTNIDWEQAHNTKTGSFAWYENDSIAHSQFGSLYNWHAVSNVEEKNICPLGWEIPSLNDFQDLSNYLGGNGFAGKKMKIQGNDLWNFSGQPNIADNESGFSSVPGGIRSTTGFFGVNFYGYYWTSTEYSFSNSHLVFMQSISSELFDRLEPKSSGASVRCIKSD